MIEITDSITTKYDCNLENRATIIYGRISQKQNFDYCNHIWSTLNR